MVSVNKIMSKYGIKYRKLHAIPLNQVKAMNAITHCRTDALGWYKLECEDCGLKQIRYRSCRNRHCPQCQGNTKEVWVNKRMEEMLPTPYYHIIFTIPSELNPVVLQNQKVMFNILFHASAETLQELAADQKYLGAEIGFMSVLHTWGQNMIDHPHIHVMIPGGGLSPKKDYWLDVSHRKYFLPVHVVSSLFRGKFMDLFIKECKRGKITFCGDLTPLQENKHFKKFQNRLYTKGWIVNIRPPFSSAATVIEYLSRYLNRVAISNARILSEDETGVTFRWKDNRDGQIKIMKLSAFEFIRRFLLHILPDRFVKIRYYGFMSNKNRRMNIRKCYRLITFHKKQEPIKVKIDQLKSSKNTVIPHERKTTWICTKCKGSLKHCVVGETQHSPPHLT